MALGTVRHVELKGTPRELDEVESGELAQVEPAVKEAKTWQPADYVLSGISCCLSLTLYYLSVFRHLPDLVSYM